MNDVPLYSPAMDDTSRRTVVLWPYDPRWPDWYRREAALLSSVLGASLREMHHVGSTAVPGLVSKPVIDILVVVDRIEDFEPLRNALAAAGFEWKGENGIAGRRYFTKVSPESPMELVHVHAYAGGHPDVRAQLLFRDYLRAHPEVAERYAELKESARQRFANDRIGYTDAKAPFIRAILRAAAAEARQRLLQQQQ